MARSEGLEPPNLDPVATGRPSKVVYCWLRPRREFRSRRRMTAIVRPLGSSGGNSHTTRVPPLWECVTHGRGSA